MNHFSVVQNLKGVSSLCESYEIFWSEERLRSGFKTCTHTTRTLIKHDMSAQMNSPLPNILSVPWASTSRNTHAGLKNEDAGYEGVLSPELREEAPHSDPDGGGGEGGGGGGGKLEAEPVGLVVQELHRMLVKESSRATRASWEIRLISVMAFYVGWCSHKCKNWPQM